MTAGRARLSLGRPSRNQSGARTFLSAATSNGSPALERSDPVERSGVAADKNVRAPAASQKSSRFAGKTTMVTTKLATKLRTECGRGRSVEGRMRPARKIFAGDAAIAVDFFCAHTAWLTTDRKNFAGDAPAQ